MRIITIVTKETDTGRIPVRIVDLSKHVEYNDIIPTISGILTSDLSDVVKRRNINTQLRDRLKTRDIVKYEVKDISQVTIDNEIQEFA